MALFAEGSNYNYSRELHKKRAPSHKEERPFFKLVTASLGVAIRIKVQHSIYIRGIAIFSEGKIQAVFDAVNIEGEIVPIRHVEDNGANIFKIDRHWHNFHGAFLLSRFMVAVRVKT